MNDQTTVQTESDSRQSEIERLARETAVPIETVHEIYETEHAKLIAHARIKTYVGVLTRRRVKELLQAQYCAS